MNKLNPKVSVLMCVYNGETYLKESVESILNQSFKDFEFIIVDDGSTDASLQIITEYSARDSRIVLVQNEKNLGLEKSLNRGLAVTKGEYVARQDADDISLSDRLELQADFLNNHLEIGALGTAVEFIDSEDIIIKKGYLPVDHESLQALLLLNNCLWHSSMMIRRDLLQKLEGYNEEMRHAEDYDLWWRISLNSRLATLPNTLLSYRVDNPHAVSKLKRKKQLECSLQISFQALQDTLAGKNTINKKVYERFWWTTIRILDKQAYKKLWLIPHGKDALLQSKDIEHLQPLWKILAGFPVGASQIWNPRLRKIAYALILDKQISVGLKLLWILASQLKTSIFEPDLLQVFMSKTKKYLHTKYFAS